MRLFRAVKSYLAAPAGGAAAICKLLGDILQELRRIDVVFKDFVDIEKERLEIDRGVAKEKSEYLKTVSDLNKIEISEVKRRASIKPSPYDNEF